MRHCLLASAILALSLLACSGDKSLVALSARVESPALDVQSSAVGADATGGFTLVMALGEYADKDTEVSLGTFAIRRDGTELLPALAISGAKFPVSIGVGQKVSLQLTFDASTEPEVADVLCQGQLALEGALKDSLSNNHPTTVASAAFTATCN